MNMELRQGLLLGLASLYRDDSFWDGSVWVLIRVGVGVMPKVFARLSPQTDEVICTAACGYTDFARVQFCVPGI